MNKKFYGVNIGKELNGKLQYERYLTFADFNAAKQLFDALILGNEQDLWDYVEIEEITEAGDGDVNYRTILEAHIMDHRYTYGD